MRRLSPWPSGQDMERAKGLDQLLARPDGPAPPRELVEPDPMSTRSDTGRPVARPAAKLPPESAKAMDLIRILLAILLPPRGGFLQVGSGGQFWLNILLTILGYIPGIVHAVWIIARR